MKRRFDIPGIISIAILVLLSSCAEKKEETKKSILPGSVISAYTSGFISRESTIKVRFVRSIVGSDDIQKTVETPVFKFKPKIAGTTVWSDAGTLEFKPDNDLKSGQKYSATLDLSPIMEITEGDRVFTFQFSVLKQHFDISIEGLEPFSYNVLNLQRITGTLTTVDVEDCIKVEAILTATQENNELPIVWNHAGDRKKHTFTIDSIVRGDQVSIVTLQYSGKAINIDEKGSRTIDVPSIRNFKVVDIKPMQDQTQYIEVRFSDPLKKNQNLKGLIRVNGKSNLKFTIESNIVKVYSPKRMGDDVTVDVEAGIKNSMGIRLDETVQRTVAFQEVKPSVRFVGKGSVFPTTNGLQLPIEAVNLNTVIVEVTQVFKDNVPQFLQVNDLNGDDEMSRVGRVVWKKTVPLEFTPDKINRRVRYGLDMTHLVENFKGGMYQIKLYFRRPHIEYHCSDTSLPEDLVDEGLTNVDEEEEDSFWDYWENSGFNSWEYYNYRHNPCHPAYYKHYYDHDITVKRNVLISDIGLIAKKGNNDTIVIIATDIKTATPLSGVTIQVLDYQQTVMAAGKTNRQGFVSLYTHHKPFVAVAHYENQSGFLRLQDGDALSESQFDVAGEKVQKGIKGFIYGERGVWRPGDSLFLTFVLQDSENRLPENHPVIFELWNARGQLVERKKRYNSKNGFYTYITRTDQDAPTGNWYLKVRVGGALFEKKIKIETVMPNRLKINLDFGKAVTQLREGPVDVMLSSTWLHGAIAKNLKADMEVTLSPMHTTFKGYESFTFDDPVLEFKPEKIEVFDGTLNNEGKASVSFRLMTDELSPGMLNAQFRTRVHEPSGAFSTDVYTIPYHPYDRYVGLQLPKGDKARGMLLTDTTHKARIVLIDKDGKKVSRGSVEVRMYKIKWRWWWEKGPESLAEYAGSKEFSAIKIDTVSITNGAGIWDFKIMYPAWGRYLIRVCDLDGKHSTGKTLYIDWPGWAGRARKEDPSGAKMLSFSSDKTEYSVGEDIILTIPTGKKGRGLISIETGSKIIQTDWFEASEEPVRYRFRAQETMAPNIYVHVTFLQPHMQVENDLPIRLYGVIPIKITDAETVLEPVITAPDVFRPEQKVTVSVSEKKKRAMTYTLAIVDEGLLDLTRFKTPDPWNHFYTREAHGVKTWDVFDDVVGAYGGKLEQLLAIGGGDEGIDQGKKKANRFPPMVRFIGPCDLKRGRKNNHVIDVPQYVGSVRIMVIAGRKKAYGSTEKQVFVRKPLMILGTLPRVLGPGETVTLPVSVFALEDKIRNVTASVTTNSLLEIEGDATKKIPFTQTGDKVLYFTLKAGQATGIAAVDIKASGGGEKAGQHIELDVRSPVLPVLDVYDATVEPGKTWRETIRLPGISGTNTAMLEVSRIPPLNLGKRLQFLIRYPHGCVEQTTSAAFPQVYLNKLLEMSPELSTRTQNNVKAAIDRLRGYQIANGGFGYWPYASEANDWSTNYAGHFLIEAQKTGYNVPGAMLDNWKRYQKQRARSWIMGSTGSELIQAYRLYTLALGNEAELGAMNRLQEEKDLGSVAKWRLAAAYWLAGHTEAAKKILRGCKTTVPKYRELSNTFGSHLRDKAMILEVLALMNEHKKAVPLVKELSEALCSKKWYSTQTTAYILIAMARHAGVTDPKSSFSFTYAVDNGTEQKVTTSAAIVQKELAITDPATLACLFTNTTDRPVFPRIICEGLPEPGKEKGSSNDLSIAVIYTDMNGRTIDPEDLEQGNDFRTEVTVKNTGKTGRYDEIALCHIFPSGWEIHNERMYAGDDPHSPLFDYQDIRDDRVYTYFDLNHGEEKSITVILHAGYIGRYYLPMVGVEAMYDATINARVPGKWIRVKRPGADN